MRNKEFPEIRFSGFKKEWEHRKIGELADIVRGASPRPIQDPKWFDVNSEVGWLRIADVTEQSGRIYYLKQRISIAGQQKTRVLNTPHLLLSIAATVGKPVVNYVKTGVHDGFLIFQNPVVDREFMFQWLEMFRPKWGKYGQPGSQVNLNSELVREQEIMVPNKEEQIKIGDFFKQIDKTIALHQQELDTLKQTRKGFLQKMFPKDGEAAPVLRFPGFTGDWATYKISDVAKMFNNLRVPVTSSDRIKGPTPYYGANGIQDYVEGYTHDGEFVLVAEDGASDLINYPVKYVRGKVWVNNHAHVLSGEKGIIDNFFLLTRINYMNIVPYLVGGSRTKLNGETLKRIPIQIPVFEEQLQIGNFFKQFDEVIVLHQQELEALKQTKKAFLQKMFV